ncbi:MAG: hypothetical protein NWQ07_02910 [Flaviramulus sp.]|nr:hypothetical protein [Flaviramulus sp.]
MEATSRTALIKGDWVLIPPYNGPKIETQVNIELGNSGEFMLFNLKEDPSQQYNLATKKPDKLKSMITEFEQIRGKEYTSIEALELH